jgi:hypothetical protein
MDEVKARVEGEETGIKESQEDQVLPCYSAVEDAEKEVLRIFTENFGKPRDFISERIYFSIPEIIKRIKTILCDKEKSTPGEAKINTLKILAEYFENEASFSEHKLHELYMEMSRYGAHPSIASEILKRSEFLKEFEINNKMARELYKILGVPYQYPRRSSSYIYYLLGLDEYLESRKKKTLSNTFFFF